MVQAALQHGLDGICFTDHIDYDYPKEPELFLFDMDAYQKELSELKEKYQNVLPICIGVELGLQPQAAEYNRQLLTEQHFRLRHWFFPCCARDRSLLS